MLLFWLLGMLVHLIGFAQVFGVAALALFTVDFLLAAFARTPDVFKAGKKHVL